MNKQFHSKKRPTFARFKTKTSYRITNYGQI